MAVLLKEKRIDLRISDEDKILLEKAALLNHLSLSSYITSIALKQATIDIMENETLLLCNSDAKLIMDLLNNPPEPNEKLKDLFKHD